MIKRVMRAVRHLLRSYRRYRDENTILVYQMGKVGSTALTRALGDAAIQIVSFYPSNFSFPHTPSYGVDLPRRLMHRLFCPVIRLAVRRRSTLKIVTLVRDPVGRNVSMFFQELHNWLAVYFSEIRPDRVSREDFDTLLDCYRELFNHRYPLEWFDRDLKRLTGVNVYEHPFDTAEGCTRIDVGATSVLIVQAERLRERWQSVEEFCGRKLAFREDNRGEHKWYATVYADFLERYSMSAEELDTVYSSRFATFFFSDEQRAELRRKWQGTTKGARASVDREA